MLPKRQMSNARRAQEHQRPRTNMDDCPQQIINSLHATRNGSGATDVRRPRPNRTCLSARMWAQDEPDPLVMYLFLNCSGIVPEHFDSDVLSIDRACRPK